MIDENLQSFPRRIVLVVIIRDVFPENRTLPVSLYEPRQSICASKIAGTIRIQLSYISHIHPLTSLKSTMSSSGFVRLYGLDGTIIDPVTSAMTVTTFTTT
jgi:hypothetical protein